MSNFKDIHINLEIDDYKRLLRFCLHRGDLNFLISQGIKKLIKNLEEVEAKAQSSEAQVTQNKEVISNER